MFIEVRNLLCYDSWLVPKSSVKTGCLEHLLQLIQTFVLQEKEEEDELDLLLQQAEALYRQYCFELRL